MTRRIKSDPWYYFSFFVLCTLLLISVVVTYHLSFPTATPPAISPTPTSESHIPGMKLSLETIGLGLEQQGFTETTTFDSCAHGDGTCHEYTHNSLGTLINIDQNGTLGVAIFLRDGNDGLELAMIRQLVRDVYPHEAYVWYLIHDTLTLEEPQRLSVAGFDLDLAVITWGNNHYTKEYYFTVVIRPLR